jgi:SAM-dependent methyltransferase
MSNPPATPNDDAWAGARVDRWVAMADRIDAQLAPITELLVSATGLRPGDRVLDVGTGTGPIARRAAAAVGPEGSVTGVDVAADMVAAARDTTTEDGNAAPVRYVVADATSWSSADLFDVVMSRFGVMFFDDPRAAFANLAALTRPSGRLSVVVWDRRDRIEAFQVPLDAALPVLVDAGQHPEPVPLDGGAFSLHDPGAVRSLLESAGWRDVQIAHHDVDLRVGGGADPADAANDVLGVGPTRIVTAGIDDELRAKVRDRITQALTEHVDDEGHVVMGGRVLVITATR